jgi:hypothetical protein
VEKGNARGARATLVSPRLLHDYSMTMEAPCDLLR